MVSVANNHSKIKQISSLWLPIKNIKMPHQHENNISFKFIFVIATLIVVVEHNCKVSGVMVKKDETSIKESSKKVTFLSSSDDPGAVPTNFIQNKNKEVSCQKTKSCKLTMNDSVTIRKRVSGKRKKGANKKLPKKMFEAEAEPTSVLDESEFVYDGGDEFSNTSELNYNMIYSSTDSVTHGTDWDSVGGDLETVTAYSNSDEGGDNELKVRPRLIAVKVPASPPRSDLRNDTNPISSLYAKYPTIRLADFARKIIFPEWIWTRFNQPPINKKSEFGNDNNDEPAARPANLLNYNDTFVPTTTTRRPKGILERPTITFDNNMSRFLRLFTVVRFQNVPCIGPNLENGTCYHGKECADLGGLGTSPCAQGLGVCCLFFKTCGETVHRNGTYFVSSGASFTRGVSTCNINIQKISPSIRQIRLDLHTFIMQPPNAGSCESDRFLISGQNTNNIIPILCGNNSGSHLYIETGTSQSLIQLSVMTTGEGLRAWSIQINQIEDAYSQYSAPSHCLQYFEGTMGTITSFNYESSLSPQYLNNLNYNICIRKEAGFCSVTYSNLVPDGQYYPFQIVNADASGNLLLPSGQAGVGLRNCPDDYILLNGIRLCGERLNDLFKSSIPMDDAPVTDITNGQFTVTVRTNDIDVGGGFSIYYRQNPCMSTAG